MERAAADSVFSRSRVIVQLLVVGVCLMAHAARGFAEDLASKMACEFRDPSLNDTSDIQGVADYKAAIRQFLAAQKFQELDCVADAARANKSQFAGGAWKLYVLYNAVQEPQGHATEEDWAGHFKKLNRWVSARPKSITARVALASAYTTYAWNARGSGYVDTVTQSGWKLFHQRIEKARTVLEKASRLEAKCPHWYVVMQVIALAEGWDLSRESALLAQAAAFEPGYYYYYRNHAHYLEPQWYGEEGDAQTFAAQAADTVGGPKGDILYFQIATELTCHCNNEERLKLMSWSRIANGVAELEKQNGVSVVNVNLLAYMAVKRSDSVAAQSAFLRIGEDWDKETWKTKNYFDSCKGWAERQAKYDDTPAHRMIRQAREKFDSAFQHCAQAGASDMTSFSLVLRLQKEGIVDGVWSNPETAVGTCLTKLKGETLSPPPYVPFVFGIDVDPASFLRSSAK